MPKRLNKKVALVGSMFFIFLVLAIIAVILYLSRDPEKFIEDADTALKAARLATDEQIKQQHYERAERNYHKARSLAKTDELKIDMLFKLVDVYYEIDKWLNVVGCWNGIIRIDPANVKARLGRLRYFHIMADSGVLRAWEEIESQASELIELAEDANLLAEEIAQWQSFGTERWQPAEEKLGPYLYLLRGKAVLAMATLGAVTDPDKSLIRAISDLEKVIELNPGNVEAHRYLAQSFIAEGELLASRGSFEERDVREDSQGEAAAKADEILAKAVELAGNSVNARINLLTAKLLLDRRKVIERKSDIEKIKQLEPEYLSLVEDFPSSAQAYSRLAGFYQLDYENLDKAIEAIEKAIQLDDEDVTNIITAINLHYRKYSISGQKANLDKAVELAQKALILPDTQDSSGPWQWANKSNRIHLYILLANCYIEQVIEPSETITQAHKQRLIADAEQAIHQIEQLLGSGENPEVIRWEGMLALARGNTDDAIRKLYMVYEQLKAAKPANPPWPADLRFAQLSYTLAKVFTNSSEVGAVTEFLASALNSGIELYKPQVRLDYAQMRLRVNDWTQALSNIDVFEQRYGPNKRSNDLRIKAYIAAREFDKAQEELAKLQSNDPNAIKLDMALVQAKIRKVRSDISQQRQTDDVVSEGDDQLTIELESYQNTMAELIEKILQLEPNYVAAAFVTAACSDFVRQGDTMRAEALANRYLEYFPDNTTVLFFKQMLSEPEPGEVSEQRRREIEEQVLSNIADPVRRAVNLGVLYRNNNEPNKAMAEFKNALKIEDTQQVIGEQLEEVTGLQSAAAAYLFDIAIGSEDFELAAKIVDFVRRLNIDRCQGSFFAARLAIAKKQYDAALAKLDECLDQRPIFSQAFMLRSNVNSALGNEHVSITDAQKAAFFNPVDGTIAKALVFALYQRNQKLGAKVSPEQVAETRNALVRAVYLNPNQVQLQSLYAEYIYEQEPDDALAVRQRLLKAVPSLENAVLLGKMAMKRALAEPKAQRKQALFDIAASAFEQAREMEPQNKAMLYEYAQYYRATDQGEKATELLAESKDQRLLWSHYYKSGQFDQARKVLEQLYQDDARDIGVVTGLLLVAEKSRDKEALKKYSKQLLELQDSIENNLVQIQAFFNIGLIKEAEHKLQSFNEKYPDEPRALMLEAWLAMKKGQLKKALQLTNRNLEADQNNALAWRLRGQINYLMTNYEQAIIDLKKSKLLSEESITRLVLTKAYLRAGREDDAITELKGMITDLQAPLETRVLLERIYWRLGKKRELRKFYIETIERFPDSVFWHNRAAEFAMATGDFSGAEQFYGKAWQKSRELGGRADKTAFDGYLKTLLATKQFDRLDQEAGKYLNHYLAPIALFGMAQAKIQLGDRQTAIEYCRKAVDKAGTDQEFAAAVLNNMYALLGKDEVIKLCQEKLKQNPDSLASNIVMFNLMNIDGQYNKALNYIDKCIEITGPDDPKTVDFIVRKAGILSALYAKTTDNQYLKKATTEYETLVEKMPNNITVLNNFAYLLAESGQKLPEALDYAKRAYELMPNSPGVLDTYGYVLYKNRNYEKAVEIMHSALQQYEAQYEAQGVSVPPVVYEHLALIKEKLGALSEAVAAYEQAMEAGADTLSDADTKRIKSAIEHLSQQQKMLRQF